MPYTEKIVAQMESTLPPRETTMARVQDYLSRSDMSRVQFAKLAGYSYAALNQFMSGSYSQRAGTDAPIRVAFEDVMNRFPVALPETEAQGTLYETENSADLRQWFHHCQERRALAYCYGPPGSQKTFVLKHLVAEFNRTELRREDAANRAFYVRASVGIRPRDLLTKLCQAAGAHVGAGVQRCIFGLRQQLRDTRTIFVLDEAQLLSIPCLEVLRELHDEAPRIGILLAGSHTLKQTFDRRASELEQWNSRLDAGIELRGVSEERARLIIHGELPHLGAAGVEKLISGSRVPDAYSRTNTSYLNVRRLFKNMDAYRMAAQAKQKGRAA